MKFSIVRIFSVALTTTALCAIYFFMTIMYPTIFALGINDLGQQVKKASSYIVMAIVGGALCPMLMGKIADIFYDYWVYSAFRMFLSSILLCYQRM